MIVDKIMGLGKGEAILRLGTDCGWKAQFDENVFLDLTKHWNIEVKMKEK